MPITCSSCGHQANEKEFIFCPNCGARLIRKICPTCGKEVHPDSKFCMYCGSSLGVPREPSASHDQDITHDPVQIPVPVVKPVGSLIVGQPIQSSSSKINQGLRVMGTFLEDKMIRTLILLVGAIILIASTYFVFSLDLLAGLYFLLSWFPAFLYVFLMSVFIKKKMSPRESYEAFFIGAIFIIPAIIAEIILFVVFMIALFFMILFLGPPNSLILLVLILLIFVTFNVSLPEEYIKALAFKQVHKSESDSQLVGALIKGISVGLGFAAFENILYFFSSASIMEAGQIIIMRNVLSVPLHAIATGITAVIYFSKKRDVLEKFGTSRDPLFQSMAYYSLKNLVWKSILPAIILHALYDFIIFLFSIYMDPNTITFQGVMILTAILLLINLGGAIFLGYIYKKVKNGHVKESPKGIIQVK